jgi:predicted lipid-binding transport protein (Tim44 family)
MNSSFLQILVLGVIAVFLILKLRSVLGTREGFEQPPAVPNTPKQNRNFEVIEGGVDRDILDHTTEGSPTAIALSGIKSADKTFNTAEFLRGARSAYEMILMAFERGDITPVRAFLSAEVSEGFDEAILARGGAGNTVNASFVGLREIALVEAEYDTADRTAELTVRFLGELTSVTKNALGEVVSGSADTVKRQRDVWTFARTIGSADPNWQLVATGD